MKKRLVAVVVCLSMLAAMGVGCASSGTPTPSGESGVGTKEEVAEKFEWTASLDCSMCHADESASAADATYQLGAMGVSIECTVCHQSAGLEDAHAGVTLDDTDGTYRLKSTEVAPEACLSCHARDYTPEATADNMLVDANGTEVNPHALPQNEDHALITCSSCHTMHTDDDVLREAQKNCYSCHHGSVFECYTCHE